MDQEYLFSAHQSCPSPAAFKIRFNCCWLYPPPQKKNNSKRAIYIASLPYHGAITLRPKHTSYMISIYFQQKYEIKSNLAKINIINIDYEKNNKRITNKEEKKEYAYFYVKKSLPDWKCVSSEVCFGQSVIDYYTVAVEWHFIVLLFTVHYWSKQKIMMQYQIFGPFF